MAELEILEALVSFLCPTNDAASSCREFISNHSSVMPPIGSLFYFLLFPLIFTILFVYILSDTVLFGGRLKWAKVLIGISAFIFIIISGLYPVALVLSEFWYILIVILGVWWFIKGHKKESGGGGGGKPSGSMPSLGIGGVLAYGGEKLIKGGETQAERLIRTKIETLEDLLKDIEKEKNERAKAELRVTFINQVRVLEDSELPAVETKFGMVVYNNVLKKFRKRINDLKEHKNRMR